ncbi:MAG: extracellular solute-binding protein [Candidatus Omnitrophota bacterium]
MKKILALLIIVIMLSTIGCGGQTGPDTSANKILVWHWMTDRDEAFNDLAKMYKEEAGIDVVFELYAPSDAYSQKVRGAAQTQTLPDIYGILSEKRDFSSFIKAGHVLNMSPYLSEDNGAWEDSLFRKALQVSEFIKDNQFDVEAGIYAIPIDVMNIQMLYNKKMFREAGLDPENPPKTWEAFLEAGRKLAAAGKQGLVSGWGEVWMIDCIATNYALNIMGIRKFVNTIKGSVPYTDPDWIKVFNVFKEMKDNNLLAKGVVTMVNKHAEQMFANERASLAFNGSWCVNVYHHMNPSLEYGAMLPPAYSAKYPMMIWGGAGSSFIVNARSQKKEEVVKFLKWLTAKKQQVFLANKTHNLPANKESIFEIPSILVQFSDDMERIMHPNNLPVSEIPRVVEARDKGIQSILIGEKTPEEVAQDVQAVKAREMEKLKQYDKR